MVNKYARNILYLLPSKDWATKERFAFRDIILAKKQGYNVLLCTHEESFLAEIAKKLEIEIIPFRDHFLNRFSSFHKHFPLLEIHKKHKIDIVHCYDFNLLLSLAFQIKSENLMALVITQDHVIDQPLQRVWFRPIISRIDSLILANKNLIQDTIGNLGLPLKKIEYFGMGIKMEGAIRPEVLAVNFDLYRDYFLAGTYVSPEIADLSFITPLFSALKVLNEKLPGGVKTKLVLITAVEFQTLKILPELMGFIDEQGLSEDILFVTTQDIVGVISRLSVWVSNESKELVEDFAISALMNEVPAILGRNFCTKDLIEEYEGVGETYKLMDARELRDKWEKIILGYPLYREKTKLYKYFIEREHSYRSYKTQLLALYARTIQRRLRLFRKK